MPAGRLVTDAEALLREWLKAHSSPPGQRLPSERALARELGVHHYAMNRAMSRLIMEGAIRRDGYKLYGESAAKQETPSSHTCDLVVARRSVHLPSYRKVARELGLNLKIHAWEAVEEALSMLLQLNNKETEGIVFDPPFGHPTAVWEHATSSLIKNGIPVVCVGQEAIDVSSVIADSNRAMQMVFNHLLELGHREVAFLTVSPWTSSSSEIFAQWKWLCDNHRLGSSKERILLINDSRLLPEESKKLAKRFTGEWKNVSALIAFTEDEYPIQHFLDELGKQGVHIPKKLSLFFLGDAKPFHLCQPSISATMKDMPLMLETAYQLVIRALRKKKEMGILPKPCIVRVQERLVLRDSTGPGPGHKKNFIADNQPPAYSGPDPAATLDIETAWRRPYDLTARATEDRFQPLDLAGHVNRPLNFRRGWLGDLPLKHFHPGRHVIHGIPFQVLGGNSRNDCGAVVFQSQINTTGNAQKLPSHLCIPLDSPATAIYVLHGCGFAKYLNRFATYTFFNGKKKLGEVPLVALGKAPPGKGAEELQTAISKANIQDWWPDYPHYDFNHARIVPLLENENTETIHRHVYLYTLEWINPSPKTPVTHIEITSNAEQSTTLGVLALSVLRP
jgi:DNA-binding LacI/PurR family transcriptional regulator